MALMPPASDRWLGWLDGDEAVRSPTAVLARSPGAGRLGVFFFCFAGAEGSGDVSGRSLEALAQLWPGGPVGLAAYRPGRVSPADHCVPCQPCGRR